MERLLRHIQYSSIIIVVVNNSPSTSAAGATPLRDTTAPPVLCRGIVLVVVGKCAIGLRRFAFLQCKAVSCRCGNPP